MLNASNIQQLAVSQPALSFAQQFLFSRPCLSTYFTKRELLSSFLFVGLQQAVYQKAGNIFFRKSVKSVVTTEQSMPKRKSSLMHCIFLLFLVCTA